MRLAAWVAAFVALAAARAVAAKGARRRRRTASAVAAGGSEGTALAPKDAIFEKMDRDGDGYLSREEIGSTARRAVEEFGTVQFNGESSPGGQIFEILDKDGDGLVSKAEADGIFEHAIGELGGAAGLQEFADGYGKAAGGRQAGAAKGKGAKSTGRGKGRSEEL
ncbi:unnamed protein product [Prorocentrum cordatum]|uniref:EF-hand domain-containing protein n=1 Tax=Prorocentrum cordatum TaxID=2364126 RepID=A0ABN9QHS1_9DINO|nr:unnamed protein product [Polarella glacialis]